MNVQKFIALINDLDNIELSEKDITELKNLTTQYPYFSVSHLLYFEYLYRSNNGQYSTFLKKIAHLIPDRKYFFQHIQKNRLKTISLKNINVLQSNNQETHLSDSKNISQIENQNNDSPAGKYNENATNNISKNDPIETINKEINKSIAESIIHSEIIEIKENIKQKAQELKSKSETTIITKTLEKEVEIKEEENISEDKDLTLPDTSLSNLLKKFSKANYQTSNENNQSRTTQINNIDKKEKIKHQQEIIDKIISNLPKTPKINTSQKFYSAEDKARESLLETEDLVTETLAKIYAEQGNIHKAIRAYEILSLKFPNKNAYFAAKIKELKEKLNKNK